MKVNDLIRMGFPKTEALKNVQVVNPGTDAEYYIDTRTEYKDDFNYIVHPITANHLAYAIVCPNCGRFHLFPLGWSEMLASNCYEDNVVVPELVGYAEDGKHFQIKVVDYSPTIAVDRRTDEIITELGLMFGNSSNPKVKEAFQLLFPDCDYSDSIDSDASEANLT